jgi:hypothetical protein
MYTLHQMDSLLVLLEPRAAKHQNTPARTYSLADLADC